MSNFVMNLYTYLEGPQPESGLEPTDRGQGEKELLRRPQGDVRLGLLGLLDPGHLLLRGQHGEQLLDALSVYDGGVHLHDGRPGW